MLRHFSNINSWSQFLISGRCGALLLVLTAGFMFSCTPAHQPGDLLSADSAEEFPGSDSSAVVQQEIRSDAFTGSDSASVLGELRDWQSRGYFDATSCLDENGNRVTSPGDPVKGVKLEAVDWQRGGLSEEADAESQPQQSGGQVELWPQLSETFLPWQGSTATTREIEQTVSDWLTRFEESGYPLADISITGVDLDTLITLKLRVDPGPAAWLTEVRFEGASSIKRDYLRRVIQWRDPIVYRGPWGRQGRSFLIGTGLFDQVEGPFLIRQNPSRDLPGAGRDSTAGFELTGTVRGRIPVNIIYRLQAAKVNRFNGLVGYTNQEQGLSGFVDLTLGNLLGSGRAAHLFWVSRQNNQTSFELSWHEPFLWRLPLELDLSLHHEMEDTLYAETKWGSSVVWAPTPNLRSRIGWATSRLVLGSSESSLQNRKIGTFGLRRDIPGAEPFKSTDQQSGWSADIEISSTTDDDLSLMQGQLRARQWSGWRKLVVLFEQTGGIISGADSLLRSDALSIGGGRSMRGFFEEAYRSDRYLLTRLELGPRPDTRGGSRFYSFIDAIIFREWVAGSGGLYGVAVKKRSLWAAGLGLQTLSRAGYIRLDYAVPEGEPIWRGRIHFGLESRF